MGNTVGVPNPRSDWSQTDPTKADYIKNKPNLEQLEEDVYASIDGVREDIVVARYDLEGKIKFKADTSYVDNKVANIKITTDDKLSATSENPVQNKVITSALNTKADSSLAFDVYYDVDTYGASYTDGLYKAKNGFVIQSVASYSESSSYYGVEQYWYTEGEVYYRHLGDEGGWENEWEKISVSQDDIKDFATKTDLNKAIGDIETSLENIIKKYGLGGDGV